MNFLSDYFLGLFLGLENCIEFVDGSNSSVA